MLIISHDGNRIIEGSELAVYENMICVIRPDGNGVERLPVATFDSAEWAEAVLNKVADHIAKNDDHSTTAIDFREYIARYDVAATREISCS